MPWYARHIEQKAARLVLVLRHYEALAPWQYDRGTPLGGWLCPVGRLPDLRANRITFPLSVMT